MSRLGTHSLQHGTKPSCYSREVNPQIDKIFNKLTETFKNPASTADEIDRALEAMKLIAPFSEGDIPQKNYHLFRVLMQAPVSPTYSKEKKWDGSRLAIHGAYKGDNSLPWVEDPQDVLTFLGQHLDLATTGGENQDEPIQDVLRALAYASSPATIEALKDFDPTVSATFTRTTSRSSFAELLSSSFLSSVTSSLTLLSRS